MVEDRCSWREAAMRKPTIIILLALLLSLAMLPLVAVESILTLPVRISTGLIEGTANSDGSVVMFKGVPYASPPVGDLRWREPQPPAHWEGIRQAIAFGACCCQPVNLRQPPYTSEFSVVGDLSEDCLFLNVWTPARAAADRLAVLVYIHGGSGTHGSGSVAVYDGEELAKKGIIVVTVNFRLGPFAGMGHPQLSAESPHRVCGNYGLLDMVAALRWVQENIAVFGGDPAKVTLCGQSSGCMAVHYLTTSPLAKGLFQGVIAASFSYDYLTAPHSVGNVWQKEQEGLSFAKAKKAPSIHDLRALPAVDLITQDPAVQPFTSAVVGASINTDGWLFPRNYPDSLDSGLVCDVPTLTGFTHDDSGAPVEFLRTTAATLASMIPKLLADRKDAFLALYPAATDSEARLMDKQAQLDYRAATVYFWAKRRARMAKAPVYSYRFDQPIPWPAHPEFGAFHSSDLIYAFDNLKQLDRPWTAVDRRVADLYSSYWVNFVKTGDPNGDGLPAWQPFSPDRPLTMVIGAVPGPIAIADAARFDLYRAAIDK
jgi:para-nitrobenzyl esterase